MTAAGPESAAGDPGCAPCRNSAQRDLPPREWILRTPSWRVAHAFGTSLPGWLVLLPTEHITTLADLTPEAAGDLGPILADLTRALTAVVGCAKTDVLLLAEAEGFAHVHFHVVPRMPDQPDELRGPRIVALLGVDDGSEVAVADRDALALRLRTELAVR